MSQICGVEVVSIRFRIEWARRQAVSLHIEFYGPIVSDHWPSIQPLHRCQERFPSEVVGWGMDVADSYTQADQLPASEVVLNKISVAEGLNTAQ